MVRSAVVVSLVATIAVGCAGASAQRDTSLRGRAPALAADRGTRRAGTAATSCARVRPGVGPRPYERRREGAGVVLARYAERTLAYVADEDDRVIHVVDLGAKEIKETRAIPIGGVPGQMLFLADGRLAVTLRDRARVLVLEPLGTPDGALAPRCAVDVKTEPIGIALTPDDATLLVTSAWGAALSIFDARSAALERRSEIALPREPRAVIVADDGRRAFVAHAVGSRMTVVDLPQREVREVALDGRTDPSEAHGGLNLVIDTKDGDRARVACQGFALAKTEVPSGRILAPQVLVDPGEQKERAAGYGSVGGGAPTEADDVAVIDEKTEKPIAGSLVVHAGLAPRASRGTTTDACLLPRAAVADARRGALFVACVGTDELLQYDAGSVEPQLAVARRWRVDPGPTAIAIDSEGDRAVVWSSFARTLDVVSLGEPGPEPEAVAAERPTLHLPVSRLASPPVSTADVALGRRLFHSVGDPRISSDGRACASCHPDGRDDAIVWSTPDGPRQTPMLAGRLEGTAPYSWSGTGKTVEDHLSHTFQRLRGAGLQRPELEALVAYVQTMAPPPPVDGGVRVARGKELFHSAEAACFTCHGEGGVAPDGKKHDVGSKAEADADQSFDTPSLRSVGGTAPYFHDGRYATLRELLVDSDGKMGHTAQLSNDDMNALERYLRSL